MRGKKLNLAVGHDFQSRQPQGAAVLPHQLRNLVADGLQASEREGTRAGRGDQGEGGIERQLSEAVEFEEGILL